MNNIRNARWNNWELSQGFCCLNGYKQCRRCLQVKAATFYIKVKGNLDNLTNICKQCKSIITKEFKNTHSEIHLIQKECTNCKKTLEISKFCKSGPVFNNQCKDCTNLKRRIRYSLNKKEINKKLKKYRQSNPEKVRKFRKTARKKNEKKLNFRIKQRLKNRIRQALKRDKKINNTINLIGLSVNQFKEYMLNKFTGIMSWDNYGPIWHIDHIIPCAIFDFSSPEIQYICFNYRNLRPLLESDNIIVKSDILPDGKNARNLPKIQTKQQLLDLIQTWPNPAEFEWVKEININ